MQLIASIHESVLLNVEQAQKRQKNTYANRPGKHLFEGLVAGKSMVKMKKPGKRRALIASWKAHTNLLDMLMGRAILILKKVAESALSKMQMVNNGRGLEEIYRSITLLRIELRDSTFFKKGGVTYVAEQQVTGQKLHGCTVCVNTETLIRVNLAASIDEWQRISSSLV